MMNIRRISHNAFKTDAALPLTARDLSLTNNPFLDEMDCMRLEAVEDDKVLGYVTTIPLQLIVHGKKISVCGGSALTVEPEFRRRGIAAKLTNERIMLPKDKVAIASGLSNMSLPLFKKLQFITFTFPRLILLKNSRPVLDVFFKGWILKVMSCFSNFFIRAYLMSLTFCSLWRNNKYEIQEIGEATEELEKIIEEDEHCFKENHTKEWFNWVLHYPFSSDSRSKQHLFVIRKDDKLEGFFMTKERFHKQASHRGFKNVILGSVIEWGVMKGSSLSEKRLCKAAILSFGKHVDAVELCTENKELIRSLRCVGMLKVGESNFAIKMSQDSPLSNYGEELSDITNWRIRPAMSDNGLS